MLLVHDVTSWLPVHHFSFPGFTQSCVGNTLHVYITRHVCYPVSLCFQSTHTPLKKVTLARFCSGSHCTGLCCTVHSLTHSHCVISTGHCPVMVKAFPLIDRVSIAIHHTEYFQQDVGETLRCSQTGRVQWSLCSWMKQAYVMHWSSSQTHTRTENSRFKASTPLKNVGHLNRSEGGNYNTTVFDFFSFSYVLVCNVSGNSMRSISSACPLPVTGLHCVLVPYWSLLKIRQGGSLSLVLSGSEHYASPIPITGGLNKLSPSPSPYNPMPWLVAHVPTV